MRTYKAGPRRFVVGLLKRRREEVEAEVVSKGVNPLAPKVRYTHIHGRTFHLLNYFSQLIYTLQTESDMLPTQPLVLAFSLAMIRHVN